MQTAALSALPEPRRMASRPVDSIAETMEEGAALPVTEMSWDFRSAETLWMPGRRGVSMCTCSCLWCDATHHRVCREMSTHP